MIDQYHTNVHLFSSLSDFFRLLILGNKKDGSSFCWGERYNVALGVAEALNYLHNGIDQPVIHRDVKSSNILLYNDFEPQVLFLELVLLLFDSACWFY